MNKTVVTKIFPYFIAIVAFVIISLAYMSPVLEGKRLQQTDIIKHKGMSKEIFDFREKTGEDPLWTNSMFSGMPAYQISVLYNANLVRHIDTVFRMGMPFPAAMVFLYMLGFFILLMVLRVNPWLGIAGAIAFGFSSYFFIIIEAGHNSKAHAIGYMAPVVAGVILAYKGKYLPGGIITMLFMALEIRAGHPQITYYLMILLLLYGIAEFVDSIKNNRLIHFLKAGSIVVIAVLIGVLTNITSLWATYEYGRETIRGKTELTANQENRTSGLDIDYATQWSYGIAETGTLLIPNFHGGASGGKLRENSNVFKALVDNQVPRNQAREFIKNMPMYWGTQPFTSGPVYAGAIVVFLFIFGLFLVKGAFRWWLLSATLLSILLAWGKNFQPLTEFFLHYFPGYNKFRAVSMTLVIAQFAMPLLAFTALNEVFKGERTKKELMHALKLSLYVTGGFCLIFVLMPGAFFSFSSPADVQLKQSFPDWLMLAITEDRRSMLQMDALRSLAFIMLTAGLIWAMIHGKLKTGYALTGVLVLVIVDMWPVNKRYLDNEDFVSKTRMERPYTKTPADELILKDSDPHYRVLNLTVDPFADASTSYFHKSIGGYHGAKLRRYQELYDYHIKRNFNIGVLNMLNTKYVIQPDENRRPVVIPNTEALGNAWFVSEMMMVENADAEIEALGGFDPEITAIIDNRFSDLLEGFTIEPDPSALISLIEYKPNHLKYQSNTSKDQVAVFSEIYYPHGWNAYVDGEPVPHFRANYVLRAMIVPSGKHLIEFRFEPRVYTTGEKISFASSLLLLLVFFGYAAFAGRNYLRKKE
ncbi:MAG: YfhO family protein [Bacteroidales bacterium]